MIDIAIWHLSRYLFFIFLIIFNRCQASTNILSDKNLLKLPIDPSFDYTTDNLDRTDDIKKKLKFDNFSPILNVDSSALMNDILSVRSYNFFDINLDPPKDSGVLNKGDKVPFPKFEPVPSPDIKLPIPKPFVKPKIPFLD